MKNYSLGAIFLILVVGLFLSLGIGCSIPGDNVTGNVVKESGVVCNAPYMVFGSGCCLDNNANKICDNDENTAKDNQEKTELLNKITELEATIKQLQDEKEVKKESCPFSCAQDELCSPVNKADGSVEWLCVDDPSKMLGPNG